MDELSLHPLGDLDLKRSEFIPFSQNQLTESIAVVFERQARRRPEALAVKDEGQALTYATLNYRANRAAHALLTLGMKTSCPVVLLFSHNANMIIAMLGTLKAGGWYAPLDPGHPEARNGHILQEIGARLVLTDTESVSAARSLGFTEEQIVNMDALNDCVDCSDPNLLIEPHTPACILYTSGSTGRPKGVVLDQQAVLHRAMVYTNDYFIGPDDRMTLAQSYVFNASVREIYGALLNGAGLYIYSLKRNGVHHLADWVEAEGITTLYLVPATFRVFLDTLKGQQFERLRFIRLGGEAVQKRDLDGFQRHFNASCVLANGLAATETGTFLQFFMDYHTRIAGSRIPAGFGVQDKSVAIEDEAGRPVADGETGEIVVASSFIGPGYFSPVEADADVRGNDEPGKLRLIHTGDLGYRLPDGSIVLVGRVDWQVKLRGQRINLLEIEQALVSLEGVAEAAVILQAAGDETAFLAAFIQPGDVILDENALRQGLRLLLPEAMVPSVFLLVEEFPRTVSGKIDRQALLAVTRGPGVNRSTAALTTALLTPVEQALAEIWRKLLGIEDVSAGDSFFDLGGDSLKASTLMAHIEDRFNRRLPLSLLLQHETLGGLAAAITDGGPQQTGGLLVTIQPLGHKPPVFFISGIGGEVVALHDLVANLGDERPLYGLQGVEFGDSARNFKTIEQAADEYVAAVRAAQPCGPYNLAGYSFGGHLALEIARRLASPGKTEPRVILIDTYPPVPKRSASIANRVRIHYSNLRQFHNAPEIASYIRGRLLRVYLRLFRNGSTRAIAQKLNAPDRSPSATAHFALAAYKPQPYSGKVVLFKATQREWYEDWDPMDAWQEFISGVLEIRSIPGEHLNLIRNPYAIELARLLKEALV